MKTQINFNWQIGFLISFGFYNLKPFLDAEIYHVEIKLPIITISISFEENPFKLFYKWLQELGKKCPRETKW